jgi:predicted transcriptional regulator
VVAIVGVFLAPKLFGPADPGCKAYTGAGLTAYNKAIYDLNGQASQARLSADVGAAVSELAKATADAHSPAVKSALNALLSTLKTVQADVAAGAVPASTVNALNTASTSADKAC